MEDRYTEADYIEAANIINSFGKNSPSELDLPLEINQAAWIKAIRIITRTKEGKSTLARVISVMKRYDYLRKKENYPDEE